MRHVLILLGWALGLLLVGCEPDRSSDFEVEPVVVPAAASSGQPHLFAANDTIWLSWIEPVDSTQDALRYAAFDGASWTTPRTAATGTDWFVNWADVPSLHPLPDGRLVAHYLESSAPDVFAYDVRITQTTTQGAWQSAITPHRDGTPTEHGFVSLLPWKDKVFALWLDGRRMETSGTGHGSGPMTLRSALITPDGQIEQPALVDARTCECCPTAAVRTADGILAAYRDRSESEVRNIGLARFDGEWSAPYLLHDDGWQINGCPVNGPALSADSNRVAAAWFTAPNGHPRVQIAFSDDSGRHFGSPLIVDDNAPTGRVDVVLLADGAALVSWIGSGADGPALRVRHVQPDGIMSPPHTLASVSRSRSTGMPRLVHSSGRIYAAWVDQQNEASRVQMASVAVDALRE